MMIRALYLHLLHDALLRLEMAMETRLWPAIFRRLDAARMRHDWRYRDRNRMADQSAADLRAQLARCETASMVVSSPSERDRIAARLTPGELARVDWLTEWPR